MKGVRNDFTRVLRGEDTGTVPFWEVWFEKHNLVRGFLGKEPVGFADRLPFIRRMGWQYTTEFLSGARLPSGTAVASDGTLHYIQGALRNLDQIEATEDSEIAKWKERILRLTDQAHSEGIAVLVYLEWCFHAVATSLGLEGFAYKTEDDRAFLHTAMEIVETGNRRIIEEIVLPAGVDAVLFDGDCAYKSGLMVSPDVFRELVFERTGNTVAALREKGIPFTLHSDGKVDELLPVLIELGFSAFHGVEAAANDLTEVKRRFGADIVLVGNMDVDFLSRSRPREIHDATVAMMDIGSLGGGYMAGCNTSPCDYIPDENYLAMVDAIRGYRPRSERPLEGSGC